MSRARAVVIAVVTWCAVVALVASLVWVVIARAGAGVLPATAPRAGETGSLPVPQRSGGIRPGSVHTQRPSAPGSTSSAATTPTAPVTTGSGTPPSSPIAVGPQRRSWSGPAGHVVVECRGSSGRLVSAYPNTGWRYEILSRGPDVVRARFKRIGEDRATTVTGRCEAGVPHFSVTTGQPGDE